MKNKISLGLYFLGLILLVIFIISFAKNNALPVNVKILSGNFMTQLWIIIMISFFIGIFTALSFSLYYIIKFKVKLFKLSKQIEEESDEKNNLFTEKETIDN